MKIIPAIFLFVYLFSSNTFSQINVSYDEMVFPSDMNKYPILIEGITKSSFAQYDDGISELINSFIAEQDKKKEMVCILVRERIDSVQLPASRYKYVIRHELIEVQWSGQANYKTHDLTFYFYDRINNKRYRPYGRPVVPRGAQDPNYPDVVSNGQHTFFQELKKIYKNLNEFGPEKTFRKELKKQNSKKIQKVAFSVVLGGLTLGLIIAAVVSG